MREKERKRDSQNGAINGTGRVHLAICGCIVAQIRDTIFFVVLFLVSRGDYSPSADRTIGNLI